MTVFPSAELKVDLKKIEQIKHTIDNTLRLITFSRQHLADDLLDAYLTKTTSLKDLLSIKNAQMEAETEEEVELYADRLRDAMSFIAAEILSDSQFQSEVQLFQLFRLISPEAHQRHPNKYRQTDVQIGRYVCPEPFRIPALVSDLFYQMEFIENPIIRAIYFHHELIRIHPFADGNGRTVRMAKNWILMYKLCPPIFISGADEKRKYVEALESSFLFLNRGDRVWNPHLELFFDQELERLFRNVNVVYKSVVAAGQSRIS